jgi:hypothetical protein
VDREGATGKQFAVKFCEDHWALLRKAIDDRGLGGFVADSGEQLGKMMVSEATEGRTVDNFDPLMGAHNAIMSNALDLVGIALCAPNEDGSERCPLCFLTETHKANCDDPDCTVESFDHWIDKAADDMQAASEELGGGS